MFLEQKNRYCAISNYDYMLLFKKLKGHGSSDLFDKQDVFSLTTHYISI